MYEVTITATDNGTPAMTAMQALTITVTDVNDNAPVFAEGPTATVAYAENTTTEVTTVGATDADTGQTVTFTLSGGADAGLFAITPTGVLRFKVAPDYEVPTDTGTDNMYEVTITATDNGTPAMTAMQALTITVTDVTNEHTPADHFVLKITTTAGININSADKSFTFYTEDTNYDIDWGNDQTFDMTGVSGNQSYTFATAGVKTIRFRNLNDIYINDQADKAKYTSIEQWGTATWNAGMAGAFQGAWNLTVNSGAGTPDMSAVTNMSSMFRGATSFNSDISGWNTVAVTTTRDMFYGAISFNGDISGWNTAQVTTMRDMFRFATSFNQDIGRWNTLSVRVMWNMFRGASTFNQDIGNWNTASVEDMDYMFSGATSFDQDIGGWNVEAVGFMEGMFSGITLSMVNYDLLLVGWNRQNLQTGVTFHGGTSKYKSDAAYVARANMILSDDWAITDGGRVQPGDAPTDIFLSSTSIAENAGANAVVGTLSTNGGASSYAYALVAGTGDTDNTSFRISGTALQLIASADYETKPSYAVRLKVDGVTPAVAKQFTITVTDEDVPTGLEAFTGISVYPNPVGTVLHISGVAGSARYTLSGMDGKVLKRGKLKADTGDHSVTVRSLKKGIYLLQLTTGEGSVTRKIVKE